MRARRAVELVGGGGEVVARQMRDQCFATGFAGASSSSLMADDLDGLRLAQERQRVVHRARGRPAGVPADQHAVRA